MDDTELQPFVEECFEGHNEEFYRTGLQPLTEEWKNVLNCREITLKKYPMLSLCFLCMLGQKQQRTALYYIQLSLSLVGFDLTPDDVACNVWDIGLDYCKVVLKLYFLVDSLILYIMW